MKHKKTVKDGYDTIAGQYLATRTKKSSDVALLNEFANYLQPNAKVLDAGCGAGVPVAKFLSENFDVMGIDFSEKQVELAKKNVPDATFVCQDMTQLDFPAQSFDGICSFYAIIHIPREEHRTLLENFHHMLKPGGVALLCLGADDLPGDIHTFHNEQMYWSHFDATTYETMLTEIGFAFVFSNLIADESYDGEHLFVLVKKGRAVK